MTNKNAIRVLENIEHYLIAHTNESCEEEHMAISLAIKALRREVLAEKMTKIYLEELREEADNG